MNHVQLRATPCRLVCCFTLTLGLFSLLSTCASVQDPLDWIRIGVTTKAEVIARYGQPDMVMAAPGGDTAVYRPAASGRSVPRLEIPTAQAGPFGAPTTRMQPIDPGLGAKALDTDAKVLLKREIRIRYDTHDVVQELSPP